MDVVWMSLVRNSLKFLSELRSKCQEFSLSIGAVQPLSFCPQRHQEPAKSLSENYVGSCFRGKGWMARRDEGASPQWGCDRGATKPAGLFRENPPGGGSFACGERWLGRHSPLRGCSDLAALAAAKIPRRRTPRNFQTGSQKRSVVDDPAE